MASQTPGPRPSASKSTVFSDYHEVDSKTDKSHSQILIIDRFGRTSVAILLGGTVIILGCMGFLAFLWTADETNRTWQQIAVSGWVTRSITIVALILRGVINAQATLATSMIAALCLKRYKTRLFSVPEISILRVANFGPRSLIPHLPSALTVSGAGLWVIVALMALVTLSLQLMSTALLSDVGRASIVTIYANGSTRYGISSNSSWLAEYTGSIVVPPHDPRQHYFPSVAEFTKPGEVSDISVDTGISIQGFLPISSRPEREATLLYHGMLTVLDTQVVCFRPSFDILYVKGGFDSEFKASGTIWLEETLPGLESPILNKTEFNCPFTMLMPPGNSTEWTIATCQLGQQRSALRSILRPILPDPPEMQTQVIRPDTMLFRYTSTVHLFINTTGTMDEWVGLTPKGIREFNNSTSLGSREWIKISTENTNVTLSMTACTINPLSRNIPARVLRPKVSTEPSAKWVIPERSQSVNSVHSEPYFDTKDICTQLGATFNHSSASTPERGMYDFAHVESWTTPISELMPRYKAAGILELGYSNISTHPVWLGKALERELLLDSNRLALCPYTCSYDVRVERKYPITLISSVFQSVVQNTGSVAHAFQAIIKLWAATAYYESLPHFDATAPAVVGMLTEVDKPVRTLFALIIGSLLLLHIVLVAIVTITFTLSGSDLIIGGAWAALAPVFSGDDTARWLSQTSRLTDGQVKKQMKSVKANDILVGLENEGDQLRLRRKEFKYESLDGERGDQYVR